MFVAFPLGNAATIYCSLIQAFPHFLFQAMVWTDDEPALLVQIIRDYKVAKTLGSLD